MENENYKELGGWLLFYYVTGFFAIVLNLWIGLSGVKDWIGIMNLHQWDNNKIVLLIITVSFAMIALVITRILIMLAITTRKSSTTIKKLIVIETIINLVTTIFAFLILYSIVGSQNFKNQGIFRSIMSAIIPGVIWYTYFENSIRVAVYTSVNNDNGSNEMNENKITEQN